MTDEKELGKALKAGQDEIEIEFDLVRKVVKIRAVNKAAWVVCIGAISVAVVAILAIPATGGASTPASGLIATPAVVGATAILGEAIIPAITIAVAAGGVGALNELRNYNLEMVSDTKAILRKKK